MDLLSTSQTVEKLKMYDDAKGGVKIKRVGFKLGSKVFCVLNPQIPSSFP